MSRLDSIDISKEMSDQSENETEDEQEQAKPVAEELKKDEDPEPEKLLKKKRARVDKPFDENMLTSGNGLERIYQEFPNIYKCGGRGSEAKSLKKLTAMYKEWAFQLHRGLAFQDVLSRCEALGSRGQVRSQMDRLREAERDRYIDILAKSMPVPPTPPAVVTASSRTAPSSSSSSSSFAARLESLVAHDDNNDDDDHDDEDEDEEKQIGLSDSEEEDEDKEVIDTAVPPKSIKNITEKSPTSVSADNIVDSSAVLVLLEDGSPSKKARKTDLLDDDIFSETEEAASLASPAPVAPAAAAAAASSSSSSSSPSAAAAAKGAATFSSVNDIEEDDGSGTMDADYTQIDATLVE